MRIIISDWLIWFIYFMGRCISAVHSCIYSIELWNINYEIWKTVMSNLIYFSFSPDRARESRPQRSGHTDVRAPRGGRGWCWTSSEYIANIYTIIYHNDSNNSLWQFEANRKRDAELLKLRKLLEDVHLESEETATLLKKKHNEIITDFQEQVEILTKNKAR